MSDMESPWPRIRDLPEEEREPFRQFLVGQTCPSIDDPIQDAYYPWDYDNWKRPPRYRFFD